MSTLARAASNLATTEKKPPKDTPQPDGRKERRSSSASSSGESSTDETIDYQATNSADPADSEVEPRTVRKGKDYRPPSTFHKKKFAEQTWAEHMCDLATCPDEVHIVKPESFDRGPIPVQPVTKEHMFILSRAFIPLAIQGISQYLFPDYKFTFKTAYPFYFLSFIFFALSVVWRLNYYCTKIGTLDEKNYSRDRTPDKSVNGLAKGILTYMIFRTAFPFYFNYNNKVNVLTDFYWSFPIRLGLWEVTLDYFFYVYHRSCHEVDFLWFIHSHHHTTKHPTAILAILAGDYQEVLEIAVIPVIASLLVPMTFSELYVAMCYTIYVEMLGHSGVRSYWAHPILGWILKPFDMDLAVEDHELHHRFGKSGKNYGKQSRVWDKIYGTIGERVETYAM